MEPIIPQVDKKLVKQELNESTFLRYTSKANNELYVIDNQVAPNALREVARLREITFRDANAGTGKALDLQDFDLYDKACKNLILWDPDHEEIIGGYRFTDWGQVAFEADGQPKVNTSHLFTFTPEFIQGPFSTTIEMARAWVRPDYRTREMGLKSLYALDNLWDGLGGIVATHPKIKYLAGKVSLFKTQPKKSRNAIIYFMQKFLNGGQSMLAKNPEIISPEEAAYYDSIFTASTMMDNYRLLQSFVKSCGDAIPPMVNMYINLSPTMKTFGCVCDPDFGEVYDMFILITLEDVYQERYGRYIQSYFDCCTYQK